jgi:hypothetical protein
MNPLCDLPAESVKPGKVPVGATAKAFAFEYTS